jgi:hypothetical protein
MADDVAHPRPDELDVLVGMSTCLRAAQRLDPREVERALEAGFAALIALEAQLSRIQAVARRDGVAPAAGRDDLMDRIEALRAALTELRTLAVPAGEARVGYGFVLPGSRPKQFQARRN